MRQKTSAPDSTLAEAKSVLRSMAAEADELKLALGGSVTDALADWLASQYALTARERLDGAKGTERWEILRGFVQDWAALRRGEQNAEWLRLEREHLQLLARDADLKWKKKIITGLETLQKHVDRHPKAKTAFEAFAEQVRGPFDNMPGAP